MSFFSSGASRHNPSAPGFSHHDPFASLSNRNEDDADALDFEDTYDGLGDQLEETGDAFNDDTFGDSAGPGNIGKDFDFFASTAKVANVIEAEHSRYGRSQQQPAKTQESPAPSTSRIVPQVSAPQSTSSYGYASQSSHKPLRTGYEKYKEEPVADLQIDASLWGVAPKKSPQPAQSTTTTSTQPAKKVLSLEEVEAQLRAQAQAKKQQQQQHSAAPSPAPAPAQAAPPTQYDQAYHYQQHVPPQVGGPLPQPGPGVAILQRPLNQQGPPLQPTIPSAPYPVQQPPTHVQPTQILQNPNRLSGDQARFDARQHPGAGVLNDLPAQPGHRPQGSFSRQPPIITHPSQLAQLSDAEKAAYLEQEAKRAKRNHKIFLMSRDNGLMTPQDKSWVTKVQLQALVAATGNPNEHGTDEALAEDFYYQVYTQIQGGNRPNNNQPLNNFAQTYLFQTGGRQGGMRRHHRGPENHLQRMEQQVQRAVEAAKNRPKNKQLIIEGSLGKISFSNAKTPKPLLNIKRPENAGDSHRPASAQKQIPKSGDRKSELRCLERIYTTLMQMEDHDRTMPPPPANDADSDAVQKFVSWNSEAQILNTELWSLLRVHDQPEPGHVHPFIGLLSYGKGMKAMQRIARHLTQEQRMTILTLIVVNLDSLEVVRNAQVTDTAPLSNAMRENVELFSLTVMSTLFNILNELDLNLVSGMLSLVCDRNVDVIARSRVGVSMLTMILSRAEIIKHGGGGTEQAWRSWDAAYTRFFDLIEPTLPHIFPGPVTVSEDVYVWQLLAALGIGASLEQQQRLVLAVKDRVMDTVELAKTLPQDVAAQRKQNVNLFMRSIGLDVDLLS